MTDFEDLRMIDLVERFRGDVMRIYESRSAALFKQAGADLQNIYNFHVTAEKSFIEVQENLKNLYTSFNYAAVIINDALKKNKQLKKDDSELLGECLEIMVKCCNVIISSLQTKK